MMKSLIAAAALATLLTAPVFAQDMDPAGTWVDRWGTSFTFELCGDGTQLCGVLNDIQGDSRTEENLAFVGQEVVQGTQVGPNKWEGIIALNGGNAKAIVEITGPDTLKITGCKAAIFCSSIDYQRS
jgi:opacity protein-like surface antigen